MCCLQPEACILLQDFVQVIAFPALQKPDPFLQLGVRGEDQKQQHLAEDQHGMTTWQKRFLAFFVASKNPILGVPGLRHHVYADETRRLSTP